MREILVKMELNRFEDLIALVALFTGFGSHRKRHDR